MRTAGVRATAKFIRVSPRKVRIVADQLRGRNAQQASDLLRFHPSKGAAMLRKVLESAMANAVENQGMRRDTLKVVSIFVDEGPHIKRIKARAMGRGNRILKRMSHITVVVDQAEAEQAIRPHGTRAKARPTFAEPARAKKKAAKAGKPAEEPVEAAAETAAEGQQEEQS